MNWIFKELADKEEVLKLQKTLNISEPIAQLLLQRGISTFEQAKSFFRPDLNQLHDPFLMKGMEEAVDRLRVAIKNQERILVFGDYDVDGTTSVALMASYLKTLNPWVTTYIPDRYSEGYGVSYKGIDYAHDNDITLIVALDCGVKSIDHVVYAKSRGIDFIICDHHQPGLEVPNAVAVLDPKQEDCKYPYKELCGCGVGFKLIQALHKSMGKDFDDLIPYLDLVVTAIAADIVPITGENRILAYHGLKVLNSHPRQGLKSLMSNVKKSILTISDVVFTLAPRINAAGRIFHGNVAVSLLIEDDILMADQIAREIEEYNSVRRRYDKEMTQEALEQIVELNEVKANATVVFNENWNKGVIGIVASRLIETYHRPTIVFTKSGDYYAASARSVGNFDLYSALEKCSEHLVQFGGHTHAAGMTLLPENYSRFKSAFDNIVATTIAPQDKLPIIKIDCVLILDQINDNFISVLNQFEPFGPGNMKPVFYASQVYDTGFSQTIGADHQHIKMYCKQFSEKAYSTIGFGLGKYIKNVQSNKAFDMVYSIDENEFNGKKTIQLMARDLRFEGL